MSELENNGDIHVRLQGAKGEPGDSGSKGDSGTKGDPGAPGKQGEVGERGSASPLTTKLAYILVAGAAVLGVWFVGHDSSRQLENKLNDVASRLCVASIPRVKAENDIRDVQIGVTQDTKEINIREGQTERAAINDRYIKALRAAKRHVPTKAECEKDLLE